MGQRRTEQIWADSEFYELLKTRIERDSRKRQALQKYTNKKFYDGYSSATRDLVPELRKWLGLR